jgi:hypothetical protein
VGAVGMPGLFETSTDSTSLFDEPPKSGNLFGEKENLFGEEETTAQPISQAPQKATDTGRKLPPGAVAMPGMPLDLFGEEKDTSSSKATSKVYIYIIVISI